jgi:hypothetical protein
MPDENLHSLDAAIERYKRTGPGKRKGRMGEVVHARGLKWLERHWDKLPEEEKQRVRDTFDALGEEDVNSELETPANSAETPRKM